MEKKTCQIKLSMKYELVSQLMCKSDLIDKALLYKSVVCDKADDGGYRMKDRLFLSGP